MHGKKDTNIKVVQMSLVAQCKTRISENRGNAVVTYYGQAIVINDTKQLFTGPHTLHPGTSWPFTFTLPMHCSNVITSRFRPDNPRFNTDPNQSLPPPLTSGKSGGPCFIEYELRALLKRSKLHMLSSSLKATQILMFYPTRDIESPDPVFVTQPWKLVRRSLRLGSERSDRHLTFKERLRSMHRSKIPKASFMVKAQLPTFAVPGKVLPITLKVDHSRGESTAVLSPTVFLERCHIHLHVFTHRRCTGYRHERERTWQTPWKIASCNFSHERHRAPPMTEELELHQLMDTSIPAEMVSSFMTFNISRNYTLDINLYVRCARKTFKIKCKPRPIRFLPVDYIGDPSTWGTAVQEESVPVYDTDVAPDYNSGFGGDGATPEWKRAKQEGFIVSPP